ncbi:MAG TPA: hypothetical protein VMW20_01390 [Candidatus Nanoarchaeia archaeon]|nr:hypothetical protein [Candidatus Nanoarchaeia archaeon]
MIDSGLCVNGGVKIPTYGGRHVLTEETSTDGRTRVNVKTTAKDEIMDRINQQQRYGQLTLENPPRSH